MRKAQVFAIIAALSLAPLSAALAQGAPNAQQESMPGNGAPSSGGAPMASSPKLAPAQPGENRVIVKPVKVKKPVHRQPRKPVVKPKAPPPPVVRSEEPRP